LVQPPQRDALFASLQPVKSRLRQAELSRELGKSLVAACPAQELSKLFIKNTSHGLVFAVMSVPYAEYFPFLERKLPLIPLRFITMFPPLDILLAEDERSVAFSIVFALKCDGHKIELVADGGQAFASINAEPERFDLLITDHSMPGITGIELVQRLREQSFRGKIMVLSAHLSSENRAAYQALAVDALVSKPFDVHELRATITQLATGIAPASGDKLSPTALHNMLKTALDEEDKSDEASQDCIWALGALAERPELAEE
jgi:CheY-like chemotaxis protein